MFHLFRQSTYSWMRKEKKFSKKFEFVRSIIFYALRQFIAFYHEANEYPIKQTFTQKANDILTKQTYTFTALRCDRRKQEKPVPENTPGRVALYLEWLKIP